MNILGLKTSPAGRKLLSEEWKRNKVGVVIFIATCLFKSMFFMVLGGLVLSGLCLFNQIFMDDSLHSQRYINAQNIAILTNHLMIGGQYIFLAAVFILISIVMTALITLHHVYMAAELGHQSLLSYLTDRRPEVRLFIEQYKRKLNTSVKDSVQ